MFIHDLSSFHNFTYSEVTDFHFSIPRQQNVIQLDISVQNVFAVAVANPIDYLLKDTLSYVFFQLAALSNIVEQVSACAYLSNQ